MMKVSSASVAFVAMAATVNGRNVDVPAAPTGVSEYPSDGVSPKPTLAAVGLHELLRRETGPFNPDPANPTIDYSYMVAPDNTCGYIAGRIGAGYTCGSIATCIFALAPSGGQGYMGCCLIDSTTTTCGYRASCVNAADSSSCTGGCAADAFVTKCYSSNAPYCNTITWSEGARDYYCNSIQITTAQLASTTYRGENDDRTFSLLTDLGTNKKVSTGTSKTIPASSLTEASSGAATPTETGGAGGDHHHDHKKTPIGAIVGGVVGGVAAIALVGLALFFFLRKKKSKKAAGTTDPSSVPPPYNNPQMQQQPGTGPGGYNAVPQNQQTYYDPKHPYPSPGTQYVQPNSGVPGGFSPVQGQSSDPNVHPSSPTVTDPRMSVAATSPSPSYGGYNTPAGHQTPQHTGYQQQQQPGFQPQQQVIHEAPDNNVEAHRSQMHELA